MPLGLPFTVDTWGPSRRHRCHRFITHAHTDHIADAWAGPGDTVYATQLTMRLALQRHPQVGYLLRSPQLLEPRLNSASSCLVRCLC